MNWFVLFLATLAVLSAPIASLADDASVNSTSDSRGVHRTMLKAVTGDENEALPLYRESHALLIGASRYSTWPQLNSIPGELDSVEEVLSRTGFNVERLTDPDAQQLQSGITDFINNYGYHPDNRLLIYFSGHGHSIGDKGFLLPVDVPYPEERQEFRRKALPMVQILAWAKDMEAKHVLFVFDSCFSGSVFKSKSLPEDRERYIRKVTAEPVRQFITAGSANEEVPAVSTFTPAFVSALNGSGDLNKDGYITGSELGVHLSQLVPQFVDQTPQYGKIREYALSRGDFVFFSEPTDSYKALSSGREKTSESVQDLSLDTIQVMVWQSAEKGDNIAEYQAYIDRFPSGFFASIAQSRIDQLLKADKQAGGPNAEIRARLYAEPEMVKIPGGSFMIGSIDGGESEQPVQMVTIDDFEIGKYEVTFDEFDQFTRAMAVENVSDNGWGREKRPVINVTWQMAKDYTNWLSEATGRRYRLPVEAEWEYAARAGSVEKYSFGDDETMLCDYANIGFKSTVCSDAFKFTAEVGSFNANEWGLHDMHGNVWEWTEDCWHPSYEGLPANGRARSRDGDCEQRVLRGGAWYSEPDQLRVAQRNKNRVSGRSDSLGFRVVRVLD